MSSISSYVMYQNNTRSGLGLPSSWQDTAGIATDGPNSVIGWQSGALPAGSNTVLLDAPRSNYALQIDGTGQVVVKDIGVGDADIGQTITVTGDTYLIFNGGSNALTGVYDQAMFVESGADATITRLYAATLGRQPDLPGLEQWVHAYNSSALTMPQIEQGFVGSQEFTMKYGANLTDSQFVTQLYANILGRQPDTLGLNGWVSQLTAAEVAGASALTARAQVVDGFMTSQEFITDTGSWLVDPTKGGYADSGMQISGQTALDQAASSGYLNTNLLTLPPLNTSVQSSNYSSSSGFLVANASNGVFLAVNAANSTVALGPNVPNADIYNNGVTVYNSTIAGGITVYGNNTNVILGNAAQTNVITMPSSTTAEWTNTTIYGFVPGTDVFMAGAMLDYKNRGGTITMLDGTSGQTFNGANLDFVHNGYVLTIGNVGGGSAAEVAAALKSIYTLVDIAGSIPAAWNTSQGAGSAVQQITPGENVLIIGQASNGNTVVYDFAAWQKGANGIPYPVGNPDLNGNHVIDANELTFIGTLVGINASALTAHDF